MQAFLSYTSEIIRVYLDKELAESFLKHEKYRIVYDDDIVYLKPHPKGSTGTTYQPDGGWIFTKTATRLKSEEFSRMPVEFYDDDDALIMSIPMDIQPGRVPKKVHHKELSERVNNLIGELNDLVEDSDIELWVDKNRVRARMMVEL